MSFDVLLSAEDEVNVKLSHIKKRNKMQRIINEPKDGCIPPKHSFTFLAKKTKYV